MNYYNEIKNKLIDNEIYLKIKDYSKERHKVITYFEIGKLLYEAGSKYGESIIEKYSNKLMSEVGKKYNYRTLYRMRKLYEVFNDEKLTPLVSKLTWSHYLQLLSMVDTNKIIFYINLCVNQKLSKRDLINKIKNKEYERLDDRTKNKLITKEETNVEDFIKNPILIKNNKNYKILSEKILQNLILEDIEQFMKELGDSFCFVGSEYKIKLGNNYNYIDLLLFNYVYNCFVVVELKITELKKEHIGQIQTYMNYIDKNIKTIEENKTVGIIIVRKDDKYLMEYCSDERILTREYNIV